MHQLCKLVYVLNQPDGHSCAQHQHQPCSRCKCKSNGHRRRSPPPRCFHLGSACVLVASFRSKGLFRHPQPSWPAASTHSRFLADPPFPWLAASLCRGSSPSRKVPAAVEAQLQATICPRPPLGMPPGRCRRRSARRRRVSSLRQACVLATPLLTACRPCKPPLFFCRTCKRLATACIPLR